MSYDLLIEVLTSTVEVTQLGLTIYKNPAGQFHRTNGPAILYPGGTEEWYQNGLRHRLNGPAVVLPNGTVFWYIKGQKYTNQEYRRQLAILRNTECPPKQKCLRN